MTTEVVVKNLKKLTETERVKVMLACDYMERVINSPQFTERWLALELTNNQGFSNATILNMILSGATKLEPKEDKEIAVHLEMFYSFRNTVGYTRPSTIWTWFNRKFFKRYEVEDVAKNIAHESIGHKVGFDHKSARETTSIPYQLGYLVRDMVWEIRNLGVFKTLAEAKQLKGLARYRK
jgi:hypothetical protein